MSRLDVKGRSVVGLQRGTWKRIIQNKERTLTDEEKWREIRRAAEKFNRHGRKSGLTI